MTLLTPTRTFSAAARQRLVSTEGGPFLISNWLRTLMIHFEVDACLLQPLVPFELDVRPPRAKAGRDVKAYVSLVMFTMTRLRPNVGGRLLEWASSPFSDHAFLNVRTYVRHLGEPGIYFLAEWLDNHLSQFIGNRTFGLPYRYAHLSYEHHPAQGSLHGCVYSPDEPGKLRYARTGEPLTSFAPCEANSLDEFLMERYTAFTAARGVNRLFRIWHQPWPQIPLEVSVLDQTLLAKTGCWAEQARIIGANYSPGVEDVWIGRPRCIQGPACSRPWSEIEP